MAAGASKLSDAPTCERQPQMDQTSHQEDKQSHQVTYFRVQSDFHFSRAYNFCTPQYYHITYMALMVIFQSIKI